MPSLSYRPSLNPIVRYRVKRFLPLTSPPIGSDSRALPVSRYNKEESHVGCDVTSAARFCLSWDIARLSPVLLGSCCWCSRPLLCRGSPAKSTNSPFSLQARLSKPTLLNLLCAATWPGLLSQDWPPMRSGENHGQI